MLIKVCGMREADNIREVEQLFTFSPFHLFTFWMGFIFWPGSSRYVARRPAYLPGRCKRVGVFVDAPIEDVLPKVEEYALDMVQLHGHEPAGYLRMLRAACGEAVDIIKAFRIATPDDVADCKPYNGVADCFLFDTKAPLPGGNGEKFDWSILAAYDGATPFLLSGGIGPDDAERVRHFHHPRLAGIDLNSRFELRPAYKDATALRRFLSTLHSPLSTLHSPLFTLNP